MVSKSPLNLVIFAGILYFFFVIKSISANPLPSIEILAEDFSDPVSQYLVARNYARGRGTRRDFVRAESWYRKAAEQGHLKSQLELALIYKRGDVSGRPNYEKAAEWFAEAAKQGNAKAQFELADLYLSGNGVKRSEEHTSELQSH